MWQIFPLAVVSIFGLFGLSLAGGGVLRLRRWWTMRGLDPTEMVAESGLQEFEGQARPVDGTVSAPFTETESLICDWEIERYNPNDDGPNWRTIEENTETKAFELEHAGPTVAIDPDGAQTLIEKSADFDTRRDELPAAAKSYLDESTGSIGFGPVELDLSRRYRFSERRLEPGETCYVIGQTEAGAADTPGDSQARLSIDPDVASGWLAKKFSDPFVVADAGEGQAEWRQLKIGIALIIGGLLFAGFPAVLVSMML